MHGLHTPTTRCQYGSFSDHWFIQITNVQCDLAYCIEDKLIIIFIYILHSILILYDIKTRASVSSIYR